MNFFTLTNSHLFISIAISVLNGILLCFTGYKFLQIIQLSGYKISGYKTWLKDTKSKYISRISMLSFLSLAFMLVINAVFDGIEPSLHLSYIGLIFYTIYSCIFINYMFKAPKKTPLKTTHRMNRFIFALFFFSSLITFGLIVVSTLYIPYVRYAIIGITPLMLPLAVPLVHFLLVPFENLNRIKYLEWAKRKITKMSDLIKIGITGSYGKTSTKYILNSILSEKYNVCISPSSFNTPMGLTKVILDYLKPEHQVLIAEMGARQIGDIRFLCDIIKPKFAILTSVGNQHLATFGNIENIKKTKNELIESLPTNGFAVFNGDDSICRELEKKCKCSRELSSIQDENSFAYSTETIVSNKGISFVLNIDNKSVKCETKLLGKHNLENILMCSAMAYKLGLTLKQISSGISKLKPIAHRLELTENNGVKILDDSYNASTKGSEAALNVLALFKDERKIIVTPGLVELGEKEYEENKNFGQSIAKVCDIAIIVNEIHKDAIIEGLKDSNFKEENIFAVPSLEHAKLKLKEITKKNDVILFENDLPDNYT